MPATNPFVPYVDGLPLCSATLNDNTDNILNGTAFDDNVLNSRIVELNKTGNSPINTFNFPSPTALTNQFTLPFTMQANGYILVILHGYFHPLGAGATGNYSVSASVDVVAATGWLEFAINQPSQLAGYNYWSSVKILGATATPTQGHPTTPIPAGNHTLNINKLGYGTAGTAVEWGITAQIIEL